MKTYAQGEIKMTSDDSFAGENGQTVPYYKVWFKDSEGTLSEIGSKKDYSEVEGQQGIAIIEIKERQKGGNSVKIIDFVVGGEMEVPEGTIH